MTKYIPEQPRISGAFPVGVNGTITTITENATFTDTAALLAALDAAGITYSAAPLTSTTGTASGRIKLTGTGSRFPVGVNGTIEYVAMNEWFTPTAAQLEAIGRAPYLTVAIEYVDGTPDAFAFTDATGVATSSTQTSNTITVAGLDSGVSVAVSITGGTYSKNGGGYVSTVGTAVNGDTFAVRHTASASSATATDTTLTIGGVSDTFTSTTTVSVTLGNELFVQPAFSAPDGVTLVNNSDFGSVQITGGQLVFDAANGVSYAQATALETLTAGTYRVVFTVAGRTGGTIAAVVGGTSGTVRNTNGTFTQDITITASDQLIKLVGGVGEFNATIDDFSVKRVN